MKAVSFFFIFISRISEIECGRHKRLYTYMKKEVENS